MKTIRICSLFLVALMTSCTDEKLSADEDTECLPAKYIAPYCSANESLAYIAFLKPSKLASQIGVDHSDSTLYVAAILDLPKSVQRIDTTFYVEVRRDAAREAGIKINTCPAIYTKVNILVCDAVSPQPCEPPSSKL